MLVMSKPKSEPRKLEFELKTYVRMHARAKQALEGVVSALRARNRAQWAGKRITQEAVVNGLLLWVETLDPAEIEDAIAPHLAWLESDMTGIPRAAGRTDMDVRHVIEEPRRTGRSATSASQGDETRGIAPSEPANTKRRRPR